ncbi:MAG TPA: Gfo/Idh/MocA family oxidoreductase [Bacteroidales bacterium]|nr:Gfo/Idh/MocA family oxidoreductase [Bacteroidales bacterium]HQH23578.1 Gfo/Idh/MocA family oxidoreductase [Bacteroidales bacterium]HQJ81100.1 Gfo/Idh/MocA family oxidoreductase [Bacteroidales bacterium]
MGSNSKINRRKFITRSTLGLMGLPLLSSGLRAVAPSDRVRVAVIGLGSQGRSHMTWFNNLPEVEVAALCDLDKIRLGEARARLQEINPDSRAEVFSDFRRILDRKDIDAITCATPDHWHAPIAIMAFQSGKDVYGEKPLTYSLAEGQAMLKNLEKHNRVFQLGTQIHAGDNYHRVTELLQSGRLGKIHTVRLWKTGGSPGLGFPPPQEPPETLDWDMWLGPAPYEEYTPVRCHGTYRHFLDYSGGVFADFWCHIADIMFMSLHPKGLYSIDSRGERPFDGIADAPRWIDVDFKFKDLDVFWTTIPPEAPGAEKMHIGAHFEGTGGTLTCDYTSRFIKINNEILTDLPDVPVTLPRSPGHQQNFIDAIKSGKEPESNLHYVREMTIPMHLALISFRLKRKLVWDSEKEDFVGDRAASYLLSREYRKPWKLSS